MSFNRSAFDADNAANLKAQAEDAGLKDIAREFWVRSDHYNYSYQWTWLGLPIIQLPQDIMAMQEIIWRCKPDVIVETGVAWGGSALFFASMLEMLGGSRDVLGIDRALTDEVRQEIKKRPVGRRVMLRDWDSVSEDSIEWIRSAILPKDNVMVVLDSNHTHEHVLEELRLYAPLVTRGQYLIVCDTCIEDIPEQTHRPRPWGPGNNPKTAVRQFLRENSDFELDTAIRDKLLITSSADGYLKHV